MLKLGIPKNANIIADSAEPKSIEELKRKGWKIQGAYKGADSIRNGIDKIKQFDVFVDQNSTNILDEYALYCWKRNSDKPEDQNNHAMDAIRYALSKENIGTYAFTRKGVNKYLPD
jgi:phage terminase large subunit